MRVEGSRNAVPVIRSERLDGLEFERRVLVDAQQFPKPLQVLAYQRRSMTHISSRASIA